MHRSAETLLGDVAADTAERAGQTPPMSTAAYTVHEQM